MNTIKILVARRIVVSLSNRSLLAPVLTLNPSPALPLTNVTLNSRNMAQKSITSFFNITPKVKKETKHEVTPSPGAASDDSPVNGNAKVSPSPEAGSEESPVNGNTKRIKRSRRSSREKEIHREESASPVTSAKKKKVKRQRIESSESEPPSPVKCTNDDELTTIKLEKTENPITYESPKTKKPKAKATKKVKAEKSPEEKKIKVEKTSPPDKSPKKSPALKSYFTVKVTKTEEDNKSNGVKKENIENGEEDNVKKVAETDYNPAKSKYHPIEDACWRKGQEVPYLALAKTLQAIETTSARLKMVEILSNYLRSVLALTPEDLLPSVYLCLNQLAPAYHSLELGMAETYLMKAVGGCTGRSLAQMRSAAQRCGDLGAAAEQARAAQRTMFAPPPLSARRVLAALRDVAAMTGQASVNKKISKIQALFVACSPCEARYLIRSLEGKLRIGLAEQSLLQALAQAAAATPPAGERAGTLDAAAALGAERFKALVDEYALIVKTTYCECPNYELMLPVLLQHGVRALPEHCRLTPGVPLKPMLAHPTRGVHEVFSRLEYNSYYELMLPVLLQHGVRALPEHCRLTPGVPLKPMLAHPTRGVHEVFSRFENEEFTCEWKYDGERAQIHVPGDDAPRLQEAAIFSRNQENNTSKYPDVLRRLPALLGPDVTSCVLDCEAVAYDVATKQILPFQVLSTRKRKDAAEADIKVQVCVFVFDLLFLNGRPLVRAPLEERRALLRQHFTEAEGEWHLATARDCSSEEEVQQFLEEAVRGSCEGLMVKALRGEHARYDIARRSHNWLKLKKDYLDGVGDTIDAVVVGAYHGRGKRAGVYGGFLLACYDPDAEQFQSLCKIGTGFSDEDLRSLSERLRPHALDAPRNYYACAPAQAPDVWLDAALVLEVRCADLSLSPAHRAAAGLLHPDKGVSLRFPRFVRLRDDKAPEQATPARQIAQLYAQQDQVRNAGSARAPPLDDFY